MLTPLCLPLPHTSPPIIPPNSRRLPLPPLAALLVAWKRSVARLMTQACVDTTQLHFKTSKAPEVKVLQTYPREDRVTHEVEHS